MRLILTVIVLMLFIGCSEKSEKACDQVSQEDMEVVMKVNNVMLNLTRFKTYQDSTGLADENMDKSLLWMNSELDGCLKLMGYDLAGCVRCHKSK